jgi:hypothetical protein
MNDKVVITACYAECFATALMCGFQEGLLKNSIIDSQNRKKTAGIAVSTYHCSAAVIQQN